MIQRVPRVFDVVGEGVLNDLFRLLATVVGMKLKDLEEIRWNREVRLRHLGYRSFSLLRHTGNRRNSRSALRGVTCCRRGILANFYNPTTRARRVQQRICILQWRRFFWSGSRRTWRSLRQTPDFLITSERMWAVEWLTIQSLALVRER